MQVPSSLSIPKAVIVKYKALLIVLTTDAAFIKYENNPVLVSEANDFRDPKVFWYEGTQRWVMLLAVGQEMQIFSSPNSKRMDIMKAVLGKDTVLMAGVWECPDLFELPVEGTNEKKWVLLCNLESRRALSEEVRYSILYR